MPIRPSSRYRNLPVPSWITWENQSKAILQNLEKKGRRSFEFTHSDPPHFGHSNQPLSEHLIRAARGGWHMYAVHSPWRSELSKAITEFEKKYRSVEYSPDDIIPTPGVAGAWFVIHYTLLEAEDDVMVVEPAHYMWSPAAYMPIFSTRVLSSPSDEDKEWEPNVEELRRRMTDKTKFIVIDNPNNPTGAIYSEKALKAIVEIAGEYDIPIISDEMYGLITFDGIRAKSIAEVAGDIPVIVLNGMSKFFMRTGWRVGYVAFHDPKGRIAEVKDVAKRVALLYGHSTTGMPTPILAAATESFRGSMEAGWNFVRALQHRRDFTFKRLNEIEGVTCVKPKASLYAFPRLHAMKAWNTEEEFMLELAKEEGVAFLPGSLFGKSGEWHFRTLLLPDTELLEEAYGRLEAFMKRHATMSYPPSIPFHKSASIST